MTRELKILGTESQKRIKPTRAEAELKTIWRLKELENAFHFFIPGSPERELYLEHDELTALGEAYKERGPLDVLSVINFLEEQTPDFEAIQLNEEAFLVRKRLLRSTGLILTINGQTIIFIKDATLETINFLDFYHDFLKPKLEKSDENHNYPQDSDTPLRFARAGDSRTGRA